MTSILSDGEKLFLSEASSLLNDTAYDSASIDRATEYFKKAGMNTEQLADLMGLLSIFFGEGTMLADREKVSKEVAYTLMNISCMFAAVNQRLGE